ncbi:MAG: DNA polymerase III subunit gamma/tau [Oscillospiraceae bacterium]|nr:DNA polymerase III subunit gamma/tau [Oscillospiraceae bacterium]
MYQALYRKWRPRTFDDVVGQEHVTDTLKNQIVAGRLSHAYLFIGTRGTGKTSCAKILAKAVNCEHPENGNPCNKCRSCLGIDDGSIMDVVELDAASNNGVDNVRALRDEAIFSPAIVKKRVYIIDEVHMLSSSAFNALLKILEEPPEHLMFILATTELHKVPATILSRCQRHSFKRIDPVSLAKRISYVAEQEHMRLEPNAADLLARLADGSLRDGLSLLDQCSGFEIITSENVLSAMGLAGNMRISELLEAVSKGDTAKAISIFGGLWNDGKAPATLLSELGSLMRDILMTKVAPKGGIELLSGGFDRDTLDSFAKSMTAEELICGIDSIQAHIGSLRDGRDPKTTAELCIIGLCEPQLGDGIDVLKKRVARLEQLLNNSNISYNESNNLKTFEIVSDTEINSICEGPAENTVRAPESALTETKAPTFFQEPETAGEISPVEKECDADLWKRILAVLKQTMLPGQYNIISSEAMAMCELGDDTLTISVSNAFARGQLEQAQSTQCIRTAVQKVTGKTVKVRISENKPAQSAGAEKLDGLSRFGNVKFE